MGKRTGKPVRAIVPVHLYGQVADMDAILAIAAKYDLLVVEDACQAHGAEYRSADGTWRRAGTFGKAAAFSFYPGKNLGACGEGGAVTTDDEEVARTIRMLREHGQAAKYYHDLEGYNGRLDALQAAALRIKLRHLDTWNAARRRNAKTYAKLLEGSGVEPSVDSGWSLRASLRHQFNGRWGLQAEYTGTRLKVEDIAPTFGFFDHQQSTLSLGGFVS